MSERERNDPMREAFEVARHIAEIRLASTQQDREGAEDRARARGDLEIYQARVSISAEVAERMAHEGNLEQETAERAGKRTACILEVKRLLAVQETPLQDNERIIVEIVMQLVPGVWNDYDGDDITLTAAHIKEESGLRVLVVDFASGGFFCGKTSFPLS